MGKKCKIEEYGAFTGTDNTGTSGGTSGGGSTHGVILVTTKKGSKDGRDLIEPVEKYGVNKYYGYYRQHLYTKSILGLFKAVASIVLAGSAAA